MAGMNGDAMTHTLRLLAVTTAVTLAVDLVAAYVWLSWGPFPESAWP